MKEVLTVGLTLVVLTWLAAGQAPVSTNYVIEDVAAGRVVFQGIGGISGGGATSVLLRSYPAEQQAQILDYLFLPNFGASLQICKVEIGGDAQSTDGAESSYMHVPWVQDFDTGYEWWLMGEAKKRNPAVKLYGLPWGFPQWVACAPGTLSNCTDDPYSHVEQTAEYVVGWVAGAKKYYGLDIDYVGCWNERPYNASYLIALRRALDAAGFAATKIVAADGDWSIADAVLDSEALAAAVDALGAHYPGTDSTAAARRTGKPLWASEDGSTYNNQVGAECWARIINQNFVNGNMSASINWNVLAAYMKGTHWYRAGLMNAMQPWSGSYGTWNADGSWTAGPMIWATAHTTQFTAADGRWSYLPVGAGAGHLRYGGSYVTLVNERSGDVTIVVEKMTHVHSACVRPGLAAYNTSDELATFQLTGDLAATVSSLHVWSTRFVWSAGSGVDVDVDVDGGYFRRAAPVAVVNGTFSLLVEQDAVYTLTTLATGNKGSYGAPAQQASLFPGVYVNDFDGCPASSEGDYFSDQNGVFECVPASGRAGTVMQQMVPLKPVSWSGDMRPFSLIGHRDAKNISLLCDAAMQRDGATVMFGVHMQSTVTGSYSDFDGILFGVDTAGRWQLWDSVAAVGSAAPVAAGHTAPLPAGSWHRYRLDVNGSALNVWIDGVAVVADMDASALPSSGHGMIGVQNYGDATLYDNFQLYTAYVDCSPLPPQLGDALSVVDCSSEVGLQPGSLWSYAATPNVDAGPIVLRAKPSLCLAALPLGDGDDWPLQLAACNASDPNQQWAWFFQGVAPDNEQLSWIYLSTTGVPPRNWRSARCLTVLNTNADIGSPMTASPCVQSTFQAFWYDYAAGEIGNEATATCLGVC